VSSLDPVRARRERIARAAARGQRIGYLLFGVAIVAFVVGFVVTFNGAVVAIVVTSLVAGSVVLAPSIVLGYAAKAAEREDRERGV
jgi:hypothetical protein